MYVSEVDLITVAVTTPVKGGERESRLSKVAVLKIAIEEATMSPHRGSVIKESDAPVEWVQWC